MAHQHHSHKRQRLGTTLNNLFSLSSAVRESLERGLKGAQAQVCSLIHTCCFGERLDSTLLLHSSFKFWLKPFPALTTRKSLDKEKGRQFCLYNDIIAHSESPILNSHSFCSWSFCSTLKEALGCLDTCLSSKGLLEEDAGVKQESLQILIPILFGEYITKVTRILLHAKAAGSGLSI